MKIALGSDEKTKTTNVVVAYLKSQGHNLILFGALVKPEANWVNVAKEVALAVRNKQVDEAILFCWTGTGVAMAASKIPGIRAVTITNSKTAKEARAWNHGNILALSCFLSEKRTLRIVKTWLETAYSKDPANLRSIKKIGQIEKEFSR